MTSTNDGEAISTETARVDILQYLAADEHNVLVSAVNLRKEIEVIETVNELFERARPTAPVAPSSALVLQLMLFAHSHLFSATSMLFRCRVEEAFSCIRIAVKAALHAYRVVEIGSSPEEYVRNERHGEGNVRFLRNLHKKDPGTHARIAQLLQVWEFCSGFGSHADYRVIKDRSVVIERAEGVNVLMKFNNPQPIPIQQFLLLTTAMTFIDILGVFSLYLIDVVRSVDADWERWRVGLFNDLHDAREKVRIAASAQAGQVDDRLDNILAGVGI